MEVINTIGRRKSAVARVYLSEGTGKITINKKDITEYFPSAILQYVVKQPLQLLGVEGQYDIKVNLEWWWLYRTKSGFTSCYCTRTCRD